MARAYALLNLRAPIKSGAAVRWTALFSVTVRVARQRRASGNQNVAKELCKM